MIRNILFCLLLLSVFSLAAQAQEGAIDFIRNDRQFPEPVRYKASLPGGAVFLRTNGFTYSYFKEADLERIHDLKHAGKDVQDEVVHFHAYGVSFSNANPDTRMSEEDIQPYYHNYFLGNDPEHWASHVPLSRKVTWHGLYEGVDAIVYSKGTSLKYDFKVAAGADPTQIMLTFDGVAPQLLKDGSLRLHTSVNTVTEQAPYVYQLINGKEVAVSCHYKLLPDNSVGFDFPKGYDKAYALVIDPILVFSTFSGTTMNTYGFSATYDANGSLYAGGECFGVGWPVTTGAFQLLYGAGPADAGINKYSSNGNTIIYSTYYGGDGSDLPNNMMVNSSGELIVCGSTTSSNLPVSAGCFDNSYNGNGDIYIARFSADGSQLRAATYVGGNAADGINGGTSSNYGDNNRGEVLAAGGSIYVAVSSSSSNFPVTPGAVQATYGGQQDAVVCKLDSNLTTLQYSTYLGGAAPDAAFSLVLNSSNEIVICGGTRSADFPATSGALHPAYQGGTDGFASIINTATGLVHSTFLGTASFDHAFKIQIDPSDNILVMGQTTPGNGPNPPPSNYPISPGVYFVANGSIFIHKLNPTLSSTILVTRMGNPSGIGFVPTAFMYDVCGNTYLAGFNGGASPVTPNAYQSAGSFWLGALGPDFGSLEYGTFFGDVGAHVDGGTSRFDPQGIVYHSACTSNPNFPTTASAAHPVKLNVGFDVASFKFDMQVGGVTADFVLANNASDTGCADYTVTFDNQSFGATSYYWDFGDNTSSTQENPTHTFAEGSYTVTLVASRATGCNLVDTARMTIWVKQTDKPLLQLQDTFLCDPVAITLHAPVSNLSGAMSFHWEPVSAITSSPDQQQVTVNPAASTAYTVFVANSAGGQCVDTAMGTVHISLYDYSLMTAIPLDTTICPHDTVLLRASGGTSYLWSPQQAISSVTSAATQVWPGQAIRYTVLIANDSGCRIERAVNIHMLPAPVIDAGPDQDIRRGESTNLQGLATGTYMWIPAGSVNPANVLTPPVAPVKTTTYYLTVQSPEGCMAIDSVTIHVTTAMLPNAFSPNGDGINDVFKLAIEDERVHLKDFSVYNRYGQRVFYTQDVQQGWDGDFNGKKADLSTYFYQVRYIIGVKTYTLKGDVTLIR